MLRAGTLKRIASLQRQTAERDELGAPIQSWAEYANVSANVRMLSGKELLLADQAVGIGSASVRIRYRTDVTTGDRVVIGSHVLTVSVALPNYDGREYTDLVCSDASGQN